jgi:hypothetical protein
MSLPFSSSNPTGILRRLPDLRPIVSMMIAFRRV